MVLINHNLKVYKKSFEHGTSSISSIWLNLDITYKTKLSSLQDYSRRIYWNIAKKQVLSHDHYSKHICAQFGQHLSILRTHTHDREEMGKILAVCQTLAEWLTAETQVPESSSSQTSGYSDSGNWGLYHQPQWSSWWAQ